MEMKDAEKQLTDLIDTNNFALERLNFTMDFSREWMVTDMVYYACQLKALK